MRIYFNPETEVNVVAESVTFTLLSERKLGPQLYGIFDGGRLEEFIVSRPLRTSELHQKSRFVQIAKILAGIHNLVIPISKEPKYLFDAMKRWISMIKETRLTISHGRKTESVSLQEYFLQEVHEMSRCLECSSSPVTFCHNDLQEGNILLPTDTTATTKDLVLIDFEYSSYNYRAFDIANHFCEWTIDYTITAWPNYKIEDAKFHFRAFDIANHFCEWTIDYTITAWLNYKIEDESFISELSTIANHFCEWTIDYTITAWPIYKIEDAKFHFRAFDIANHFCEWTIDYTITAWPNYQIEDAKFHFRAFDIANHFCEWTIDYTITAWPNYKIEDAKFHFRAFDIANHFCEWTIDYTITAWPNYKIEDAKFHFRAFDIANHFCEWSIDYTITAWPNYKIEDAKFHFRAFDIANHFCEWTIDYTINAWPNYKIEDAKFPTENQQKFFFGEYLKAMEMPAGKEQQVKMVEEVRVFVPVSHFFWAVWSLLQFELSPVSFGYLDYAHSRLNRYHDTKQALTDLLSTSNTTQVAALPPTKKRKR